MEVTTYHAPNGDHPIYWPIRARTDRAQKLWLMLQAGGDLNAVDYGGLTPLVRAVEHGALNETAALLKARAEARGPDGPPPRLGRLLRAAEGNPRLFRLFLDNGAYPPPGCATRRGVDRRLAEEIEDLKAGLTERGWSDTRRRAAERRIRACRACREMLATRDATAV